MDNGLPSSSHWRNFLESNYHILSLNLNPIDFCTWLRSSNTLTQADQERIFAERTTLQQMGLLIDTIKRKGENGFKAFMEVVEFSYPEIFRAITGIDPRSTPPEGYLPDHRKIPNPDGRSPRTRPQSIELLGQMGSLVQTLFSGLSCKKEQLSRLQGYCTEMQENICREKSDLYLQMKCCNERNQILQEENEDFRQKLENFSNDRRDLSMELERLIKANDDYMEKNMELNRVKDELSCKVKKLEDELTMYQTNPVSSECADGRCNSLPSSGSVQEISVTLNGELNEARKKNLVKSFENAQLEGNINVLKNQYQALQQQCLQQSDKIKELIEERNLVMGQKQSLESEIVRVRAASVRNSCTEKYMYMESHLKRLQDELEFLKSGRAEGGPNISSKRTSMYKKTFNASLENLASIDSESGPNLSSLPIRRNKDPDSNAAKFNTLPHRKLQNPNQMNVEIRKSPVAPRQRIEPITNNDLLLGNELRIPPIVIQGDESFTDDCTPRGLSSRVNVSDNQPQKDEKLKDPVAPPRNIRPRSPAGPRVIREDGISGNPSPTSPPSEGLTAYSNSASLDSTTQSKPRSPNSSTFRDLKIHRRPAIKIRDSDAVAVSTS